MKVWYVMASCKQHFLEKSSTVSSPEFTNVGMQSSCFTLRKHVNMPKFQTGKTCVLFNIIWATLWRKQASGQHSWMSEKQQASLTRLWPLPHKQWVGPRSCGGNFLMRDQLKPAWELRDWCRRQWQPVGSYAWRTWLLGTDGTPVEGKKGTPWE